MVYKALGGLTMDYTCENCKNWYTWGCDHGCVTHKCEDFKLDESTLSESEREVLRVLSYIMGGKND